MEKLFKGTSVTAFRIHRTTCPPSDVLHSQIGALGRGDMERGKEEGRGWTEGNTSKGKMYYFRQAYLCGPQSNDHIEANNIWSGARPQPPIPDLGNAEL